MATARPSGFASSFGTVGLHRPGLHVESSVPRSAAFFRISVTAIIVLAMMGMSALFFAQEALAFPFDNSPCFQAAGVQAQPRSAISGVADHNCDGNAMNGCGHVASSECCLSILPGEPQIRVAVVSRAPRLNRVDVTADGMGPGFPRRPPKA